MALHFRQSSGIRVIPRLIPLGEGHGIAVCCSKARQRPANRAEDLRTKQDNGRRYGHRALALSREGAYWIEVCTSFYSMLTDLSRSLIASACNAGGPGMQL